MKILENKRKSMISLGFTLVEVIISSALFLMGMTLVSQVYLSLVKSVISAQKLQANIDNTRFGLEKIWNEVKTGVNFPTSSYNTSVLEFKDRRCRQVKIQKSEKELVFEVNGATTSIFDPSLIEVNDFYYYLNELDDPNSTDYTVASRKLVNIFLDLNFKTENGLIPYQIRTSIAPLASPRSSAWPCQ